METPDRYNINQYEEIVEEPFNGECEYEKSNGKVCGKPSVCYVNDTTGGGVVLDLCAECLKQYLAKYQTLEG